MLAGLLALLSSVATFIPIVGPIIEGVTTIYKQKTDTKVALVKEDNALTVQEMSSANQVTSMFVSDVAVRICRDIIMFPGSIFCGTIIWDRWIELRYPDLVWGVKPLMGSMEYLPHILLLFFFGSAALYWMKK